MGAIGRLFGVVFGRIIGFFGTYISGKLLILGAGVAAFLAMLLALNALFNLLLGSLSMAMPVEFQWGLGFIPQNIPTCVSAIITARAALWIFQVKWAIIKVKING